MTQSKGEATRGYAQMLLPTLVPMAALFLVLGHAFAWVYARSYFGHLGAHWIAGSLSWLDRYALCDWYLAGHLWMIVVIAFQFATGDWVAERMYHKKLIDMIRWRWLSWFLLLSAVPVSVIGAVAFYWYDRVYLARDLSMALLVQLFMGMILLLSFSLVYFRAGDRRRLIRSGAALLVLVGFSVLPAPRILGILAAEIVARDPGKELNRARLKNGEDSSRWYLVQATAHWLYLGRIGEEDEFDRFQQVEPDMVEVRGLRWPVESGED